MTAALGWRPGLPTSGDTVVGEYPARLDALHERVAPGALVAAPTGYVLASPAVLAGDQAHPLARFGLAVVAHHPGAVSAGPAVDRFADGLLALHHQLLRAALRHALWHLGERTSGGVTLLTKQLIQGQVADVAQRLSEHEAMPLARRQGDPAARWRSHQRLRETAHHALMLLGASGFLACAPAADLYLAAVTGNVYLHPGTRRAARAHGGGDD